MMKAKFSSLLTALLLSLVFGNELDGELNSNVTTGTLQFRSHFKRGSAGYSFGCK